MQQQKIIQKVTIWTSYVYVAKGFFQNFQREFKTMIKFSTYDCLLLHGTYKYVLIEGGFIKTIYNMGGINMPCPIGLRRKIRLSFKLNICYQCYSYFLNEAINAFSKLAQNNFSAN